LAQATLAWESKKAQNEFIPRQLALGAR